MIKTKKKIIGIYADTYNGKVGQTFAYIQFFSQFGYVRMISTCDKLDNIENEIDVLVIPGGSDVDATLYNSVPGVMDSRTNQHYEYLDKILIPKFVDAEKPIIGICRGLQRMNVFFEGTLTQHITGHHQGENRVKTDQEVWMLNLESGIYDKIIKVNTMHHQCVGKLGKGLKIIGYSDMYLGSYINDEDLHIFKKEEKLKENKKRVVDTYGIPEIIVHEELPILLMQFHPEEYNCRTAVRLITKLLEDE